MEIINNLLIGPVLPATMFLGFMVLWSSLALIGAVDLDVPGTEVDVNLDVDLDAGGGWPSDGLALLMVKWLNLKEVPLVLWLGALAVFWWFISACLWTMIDCRFFSNPGWVWSTLLVARNLAIAIPVTKLVTHPMKGWFVVERLDSQSLIGKECQISSTVATTEFGQVKFKTEGSPLLLNVRTDGPSLAQGTHVWITHYDPKQRVFIVSPTTANGPVSDSTSSSED